MVPLYVRKGTVMYVVATRKVPRDGRLLFVLDLPEIGK